MSPIVEIVLIGPVIITGGCGVISSHLVDGILASEPGCQIHIIDINTTRNCLDNPRVTYHTVDITHISKVEAVFSAAQPCTIFHVACPDSMVTLNVSIFQKVNVNEARNLLNTAEKLGIVIAFVNIYTLSVIHDNKSDLIDTDEKFLVLQYPTQKRIYTLTKAKTESNILAENRKYSNLSMLIISLRPATTFGERDTICMGKFVAACREGKRKFQIGSGKDLYDVVYISNPVDVHLLAAYSLVRVCGEPAPSLKIRINGQIFNITNDERILF